MVQVSLFISYENGRQQNKQIHHYFRLHDKLCASFMSALFV